MTRVVLVSSVIAKRATPMDVPFSLNIQAGALAMLLVGVDTKAEPELARMELLDKMGVWGTQ